ncbi:MAG: peptidase M24 [Robiginitomaculum sp.]|nr:MAG: peptidase M24 [Robiginitomaculum sp.]
MCTGTPEQGALMACRTTPNAAITLSDDAGFSAKFKADPAGRFVVGFSRDAAPHMTLRACANGGACAALPLSIVAHDYKIERINGLPPGKVSTFSAAQLVHIRKSSARKKAAFAIKADTDAYLAGFAKPVQNARISGFYGSQRVLNGKPKRPHMGMDFAVPKGTPIAAPAGGVVTLADPDLYFEGGTVFLDHGQGLVSVFMHMSSLDVHDGQRVKKGDILGKVGATGRATGPHLHWSLKWKNRYYVNPDSALSLDVSPLR